MYAFILIIYYNKEVIENVKEFKYFGTSIFQELHVVHNVNHSVTFMSRDLTGNIWYDQ